MCCTWLVGWVRGGGSCRGSADDTMSAMCEIACHSIITVPRELICATSTSTCSASLLAARIYALIASLGSVVLDCMCANGNNVTVHGFAVQL